MNKYTLWLLNEEIRIVSEKDSEYAYALRDYILATIEKFDDANTAFPMSYIKKALYASVFLADELFCERAESKALLERLTKLESALDETKAELDKMQSNQETTAGTKTGRTKKTNR